jgi:hypothetical protein
MLLDPSFFVDPLSWVGGGPASVSLPHSGRRRDAEHNADEWEATRGGKKNRDGHTNALACRDGAELEAREEGKDDETERPVTEEKSIDPAGAVAAFGRWYLEWNQVARLPSSSARCRDSFVLVVPATRTVHRPGFVVITSTKIRALGPVPRVRRQNPALVSLIPTEHPQNHLPSSSATTTR